MLTAFEPQHTEAAESIQRQSRLVSAVCFHTTPRAVSFSCNYDNDNDDQFGCIGRVEQEVGATLR